MTEFVQMHLLVSYPPANLNRDDLGRPKTATMGDTLRLRISSQSLKRAWRTSEVFDRSLAGHLGVRTKMLGDLIARSFTTGLPIGALVREGSADPAFPGVDETKAHAWARELAGLFGKVKKEAEKLEIEQLMHISPEEITALEGVIADAARQGTLPPAESMPPILTNRHTAADIAMFGRMLAASPAFNAEAAVQVAHAISVHQVVVEDDFFTAVDDLNRGIEDVGAGHMGETEFAAGLFYLYLCVNRDLLVENLQGDRALADAALRALVEAAATVSPTGKQATFGSRARASYLLAEKGTQQPRSLSVAFLTPLTRGGDMLGNAIAALRQTRDRMDAVYGACSDSSAEMNAHAGTGSFEETLSFVAS
jgi:CRISPR system Cascade subunit CasC